MPDDVMTMDVKGLKELQKKATQMIRDMQGAPISIAMRNSVLKMQRRVMKPPAQGLKQGAVKGYIPVDTGRLRASMTPVVRQEGRTVRGIVGSNVTYGPYQEFGTKFPRKQPPVEAMQRWAAKHRGANAFLVGRAIARRGGRALHFMRTSLEETREYIMGQFNKALRQIVNKRPG